MDSHKACGPSALTLTLTLDVQSGMAIWLLGLLTAELMLGHHTISQVTPAASGPLSLLASHTARNTQVHERPRGARTPSQAAVPGAVPWTPE